MIDQTSLSSTTKSTLRNRFYAAKNRAERTETNFQWSTFADWLIDFCRLAPADFSVEDYRLSYDNQSPAGYAPETMRFAKSSARRRKETAQAFQQAVPNRAPQIAEVSEMQRMLFTAELTLRIKAFQVDQTFDELVAEAAAAAGIELR
jgi:hypothetical protein